MILGLRALLNEQPLFAIKHEDRKRPVERAVLMSLQLVANPEFAILGVNKNELFHFFLHVLIVFRASGNNLSRSTPYALMVATTNELNEFRFFKS